MRPILLIPGIGGSVLVKKGQEHKQILNQKLVDNRWINIYPYNPLSVKQWKQEMGVEIIRDQNGRISRVLPKDTDIVPFDVGGSRGVQDVVPEFTFLNKATQNKLESAFQYRYFHTLCSYFHRHGYVDHNNLLGLPYDFRLVLDPQYRQQLFEQIRTMIEGASLRNGGEKVVIVGHSLGCILFKWFLTTFVDQGWIDAYVQRFICISAPFGGAMFAMRAVVSGDYYVPLFHKVYKEEIQTNTGIVMCLPNRLSYDNQTPLMDILKDNTQVNLDSYSQLADRGMIAFELWRDLYEPHLDVIAKTVRVPTHVVCCIDKNAPSMYYTDTLDDYPYQTSHVRGDGVVDSNSLLVYEKVFDRHHLRDFIIPRTGHTQMISDPRVLHLIHQYARSHYHPHRKII